MAFTFSSQELWQIGIWVGVVFLIIISIMACLSGGLEGLWYNFCSWCEDIDFAFRSFGTYISIDIIMSASRAPSIIPFLFALFPIIIPPINVLIVGIINFIILVILSLNILK